MAHCQKISAARALAFLERFPLVDPCGVETVAGAIAGATCLEIKTPSGRAVIALDHATDARTLWINAGAAKAIKPMTGEALAIVENFARFIHAERVEFQTARRGLVRITEKLGYHVRRAIGSGWVMSKSIC